LYASLMLKSGLRDLCSWTAFHNERAVAKTAAGSASEGPDKGSLVMFRRNYLARFVPSGKAQV
jgi:hypothetical protein